MNPLCPATNEQPTLLHNHARYDLAGHEISEVSATGGWNRGEIYAGGRHLATYNNGTTYFNHADWLGTERARTSMAAAVCETVVNTPFGDGQAAGGSCSDASPMHFTGKQRDTETNLDDFGARYFTSAMGRWVTPDWSARPSAAQYADLSNPQSLNLYAYVNNNPTTHVDADGHAVEEAGNYAQDMEMQGDSGGDEFADTSAQSGDALGDPNIDADLEGREQQALQAQQQNEQAREAHSDKIILGQFEKVFGQTGTGAHLGAHNGHENEEITTKDTPGFESKLKSNAVHTPNNTSRFDIKVNGKSYNLHVEFPNRQGQNVSVKVHIDVGNPSEDLAGAIRHLVIDVGIGKAEYHNSAGLDPY